MAWIVEERICDDGHSEAVALFPDKDSALRFVAMQGPRYGAAFSIREMAMRSENQHSAEHK